VTLFSFRRRGEESVMERLASAEGIPELEQYADGFAAHSGAGLRDLMARMGHGSERAAMIYQNTRARGAAQLIASAIDAPFKASSARTARTRLEPSPRRANSTLMAGINNCSRETRERGAESGL
jgi:hypothetical protein